MVYQITTSLLSEESVTAVCTSEQHYPLLLRPFQQTVQAPKAESVTAADFVFVAPGTQDYLEDDGSVYKSVYEVSCPAPEEELGLLPAFLAELPNQNAEPGKPTNTQTSSCIWLNCVLCTDQTCLTQPVRLKDFSFLCWSDT